MDILDDIIDHIISIFTVINVLLYVYSWVSNKASRPIQLLTLYVVSLFVTHFTVSYYFDNGMNNLFISHYHFCLQFLFLGLFYRDLFEPWQKKWVSIIMVSVFTILIGYYIIKPEKYAEFNLIDIFITIVPLIAFSIIHLYNMLTARRKFFIINAGILIYLSTTALIFFLATFWNTEKEIVGISEETATNIWTINKLIYLIYLIFIAIEWKSTFYKWKAKNN